MPTATTITITVEDKPTERQLLALLRDFEKKHPAKMRLEGEKQPSKNGKKPNPNGLPETSLAEQFELHFQRWKKETAAYSGGSWYTEHPDYQQIIKLGEPSVPLILKKLQTDPQYLFQALNEITGQNPVPEEHIGILNAMAADWIDWGKKQGILLRQ